MKSSLGIEVALFNTQVMDKVMSKLLLIFLTVFSVSCKADYSPDFRGLIPSVTTLEDFKKSSDFKNCKDTTEDFYKGLATSYLCLNLSQHIEKLKLVFFHKKNNILVSLVAKFKDEKNTRTGSQAVHESLRAKLLKNNSKPPASMSKKQVIQFIQDDSFKAECAGTDCGGQWFYHKNAMSVMMTMWYASGNSVLELSIYDDPNFMKLYKMAEIRMNNSNASKAEELGI